MRKDIFTIPIFEDKVDLNKIHIENGVYEPTWDSGVHRSFGSDTDVPPETWQHITEVVLKNIQTIQCSYTDARIDRLWRNVYTETDYQELHIHPNCQWSFIIYVSVSICYYFKNRLRLKFYTWKYRIYEIKILNIFN